MSLISNLFDGMRSRPAPVAHNGGPINPNANTQPNPDDKVPQNNPAADPTKPGNVPFNGTSNPTNDPAPISPLDQFKGLWDSPTTPDGKPKTDPLAQPLVTTDPAKLAEAARKMDFTQGLDPALFQKALGGDVQALSQIINSSAQNAFIASATLGSQVVEGATRTNNERFNQTLTDKFKEFSVREQRSDNPVLQHAAVAPILDLAKRQMTQQFPDLSASQIQAKAEAYVTEFANSLTGREKAELEKKTNSTQDAGDFSAWA